MACLYQTMDRVIAERRAAPAERGAGLSLLLHAQHDDGSGLTDQQVRDETLTLILAGHETTANALTWTWYLLAQHPASYTQLQAEVDTVVGGRTPTVTDLPRLPYALQVFKEALRLYPPIYGIFRHVRQPVQLGPYHLQPGTRLGISPSTLHRNPQYFPDPECFDPDRWTPDQEAALPRYAYLPFGAGPHMCIGHHFALLEAHLILATLAQHVTFDLVPGQTIVPEPLITLRPKGGLRVIVRRR